MERPRPHREKPARQRHKPPILGHFSYAGRTLSRSHPPSGRAGRTFSHTGHSHVATVKPPSPLRPLMQANVKPPSPMQPKNASKRPFPTRKGDAGFTREISNARGLWRGLAGRPVGGQCYKRVKPTRFQSPRENPCDKRRQSKPKNHHYQRKSRWIDDVRNNGSEIHTKNTSD